MLELYKHDYPDNYEEYKNIIWYKYNSFDNEIFDYSIFIKNKWLKIWTHQEIYESICDIIYNLDLQNSIYNKRNSYDYESNSDSDTSEH